MAGMQIYSNVSSSVPDSAQKSTSGIPTSDEWEKCREIIEHYWLRCHVDGKHTYTLAKLRKIMAEEHGFSAKESQYKTRIRKWHFWRNINKRVARSMAQIQDKRANIDKKRTSFLLCGVPISENKVKRARGESGYEVDLGLTYIKDGVPSEISYFTPKPQHDAMDEGPDVVVDRTGSAEGETDPRRSNHEDLHEGSSTISHDWVDVGLSNMHPVNEDQDLMFAVNGSSFIGMITSTHHSMMAPSEKFKTEGDRSAESQNCVWMSSGWYGKGFRSDWFENDMIVPDSSSVHSIQDSYQDIRREFLLDEAMRSSV